MNEPFEEMAIFARIAEAGSFTAAAKSLGRSKAYVSQQLSNLEAQLGIQLLFRTTRKLSLTEAGKVYLEYCQSIIKSAAAAQQSIAALQGEMTGLITISAPESFGQIIVFELLSAFQQKYPQIQISLDLSSVIKKLQAEGIDLAFRGGAVVDDDLVAIPIVKWKMVIVGTPDYLEKHGTPQTPDELKSHNCIGTHYETKVRGWPFMIDGDLRRILVEGDFMVNGNPLIMKATLQGRGLAWLPSYVMHRELKAGELVRVLQDFESPPFTNYLSYVYQKAMPYRQRRLIDFTKQWFAKKGMVGLE